jgi:hypothetical protein
VAGTLGRVALIAAPLLLVTTLLLAAVVGTGYYEFVTFGGPGAALELPTAVPGTPTPEPPPAHPERAGGITRHPATATPDE